MARLSVDAAALRGDLERLVRIPSIAFDGYPEAPVLAAAEATCEILRDAGLPGAQLVDVPGGPPAVWAQVPPPEGAPTLLLYAHYDVQPAGPEEDWTTPPWEPVERDGRLHGRGTADDKCGIAMHAGTVRALGGTFPVGLKIVVEGEEETGRGTFLDWVAAEPGRFACDVVSVADSGNWRVGEPTLTTSLRGLCEVVVEVATLEAPGHSGLFGGAAPDALMCLARMLATLHDERGDVAVAGLQAGTWDGRPVDEAVFRESARILDGVGLLGSGSVADHLYARPAVSAVGLDAPAVSTAPNAVLPSARAKLSVRLPPGEDPQAAARALVAHLEAVVPFGARLSTHVGGLASGWRLAGGGPGAAAAEEAMAAAYGKPPVRVGSGGAIPLVDVLARQTGADIVLWGAADDAARIHAADESVDLSELGRATLAQVLLVERLAGI